MSGAEKSNWASPEKVPPLMVGPASAAWTWVAESAAWKSASGTCRDTVVGVDAKRKPAQSLPQADRCRPCRPARPRTLLELRRILTPARGLAGVLVGGPEVEPPPLDAVRGSVRTLDRAYHADDYATTMAGLPLLLTEARTAVDETEGDDRAVALELMAQAYQLTGTTLIQLRAVDLAHRALTSALETADESGNETIGASAVTTMCWLLLRQGRFDETERLAVVTADAVEPSFSRAQPAHLAV